MISESLEQVPGSEVDPDQVVVRYVREDDYERIAEHLLLCFDDPWPPFELSCSVSDHLAWKLNANPESWRQQIVATLEDDDEFIVVFALRIRRPGWIRGEERVILDVADQAAHPDWRMIHINEKRGEFRDEAGHETHDLQMTWLPHHPATRKGSLNNPAIGNRVLVLWKPSSLRSLLSVPYRTRGAQHAARVAFEAARRRLIRRRTPRFGGTIVDLERFDDRTDALWDAAKGEFDFAIERKQDYLNWRYADPRSGRFAIRAALEGDELLGYCVTKPHAGRGQIIDLLVRPGRLDVLDALIADAEEGVRQQGPRDIHCWLPGRHPYAETLRRRGFLDTGRDPSFRYEAEAMSDDELAFLLDPEVRVHLTQGDSDFV